MCLERQTGPKRDFCPFIFTFSFFMVQCHFLGEASIPPPPTIRCVPSVFVSLSCYLIHISVTNISHRIFFFFFFRGVCPFVLSWFSLIHPVSRLLVNIYHKNIPTEGPVKFRWFTELVPESPNSPKIIFDHFLLAIFTEHLLCTRHSVRCSSHVLFSVQPCLQVAVSSALLPSICRNWATY